MVCLGSLFNPVCGQTEKGRLEMEDWGLAALSFAAISGGLSWVAYFAWDLYTNVPPGSQSPPLSKPKKDHRRGKRAAA